MRVKWRVILAVALCAATACSEPDTFDLGAGRDGALTVTESRFAAGDLVMVLQGGFPTLLSCPSTYPAPDVVSPDINEIFLSSTPTFRISFEQACKGKVTLQIDSGPEVDAVQLTNQKEIWEYKVPGGLLDGAHKIRAFARDSNSSSVSAEVSFKIDTQPPVTTILLKPDVLTSSRTATFTFSATDAGSGVKEFKCSRDGLSFATCASPMEYSGLADGQYDFFVFAIDMAGRTGDTKTYRWVVDDTPPVATIKEGPASLTKETTARFTIEVIEAGSGVEEVKCSFGGAAASICPEPIEYDELIEGSYTFAVVAIDKSGRTGSSDTYSWTVDLTVAQVQINSGPPPLSTTTDAQFTFSVPGSDEPLTYECILKDVSTLPCDDSDSMSYSGLAEREHTFTVKVTDGAGNMKQASYQWEIDKTPPNSPSITTPAEGGYVTTPGIVRGSAEPGSRVELFLRGVRAGQTGVVPASGAWELEVDVSGLPDGPHFLSATARDKHDNPSAPSSNRNFILDRKKPSVSFVEPLPPRLGNSTTVTFNFDSDESQVTYECSLNGEAFKECLKSHQQSVPGIGLQKLNVRSIDQAGNMSEPIEFSWFVDRDPPPVAIQQPTAGGTVNTLRPIISGTSEDLATVTVYIDGNDVGEALVDQNGKWSRQSSQSFAPGSHRVTARARDLAGNLSDETSPIQFFIDTEPPDTEILEGPRSPHNSRNAYFMVRSTDGSESFDCVVDGKEIKNCQGENNECSEADLTGCTVIVPVSLSRTGPPPLEGAHRLEVRARDPGGNVDSTPATYSWDVVITPPPAPTITEPLPGAVVSGIPTIRGTATHEGEIGVYSSDGGEPQKIGGAPILNGSWEFTKDLGEGEYTLLVDATDKADNTSPHASLSFRVVPPKPRAEAIGGGLGCSSAGAQPWLALLGLLVSSAWLSRRRR